MRDFMLISALGRLKPQTRNLRHVVGQVVGKPGNCLTLQADPGSPLVQCVCKLIDIEVKIYILNNHREWLQCCSCSKCCNCSTAQLERRE